MRPWQRPAHQLPILVRPGGRGTARLLPRPARRRQRRSSRAPAQLGRRGRHHPPGAESTTGRMAESSSAVAAGDDYWPAGGHAGARLAGRGVVAGSEPADRDPEMPAILWRYEPPGARWVAACRRCTAGVARVAPVVVELPSFRRLCRRHRQWRHRDDAFPVTAEIAGAQRAHDRAGASPRARAGGRELPDCGRASCGTGGVGTGFRPCLVAGAGASGSWASSASRSLMSWCGPCCPKRWRWRGCWPPRPGMRGFAPVTPPPGTSTLR